MTRPSLEVADIFREHGAAWRRANAGHVSLGQLKAMSAIERCRTAARRTEGAPMAYWRASGATVMSRAAKAARIRLSRSIVVAAGVVRSVRPPQRANGWPSARPSCSVE
jgi:hypothetical protein